MLLAFKIYSLAHIYYFKNEFMENIAYNSMNLIYFNVAYKNEGICKVVTLSVKRSSANIFL